MNAHKRVFTQTFGAVGAILEKEGKILLVKENLPGPEKGMWSQPAGWIKPGQDPIEAAVEQVREETGYDFEPNAILGVYSLVRSRLAKGPNNVPHAIKIIFLGNFSGTPIVSNEEIAEIRWYWPKEVYAMAPKVLRHWDIKDEIRDYFSGKKFSLDLLRHTIGT